MSIKFKEGEIALLDDGFYYYWPRPNTRPLSPNHLRKIADYLDEKNRRWSDEMEIYFNEH